MNLSPRVFAGRGQRAPKRGTECALHSSVPAGIQFHEGGASSLRDAPDDSGMLEASQCFEQEKKRDARFEGELIGLDLQRALLGTEGFHRPFASRSCCVPEKDSRILHRLLFSTLMLHRCSERMVQSPFLQFAIQKVAERRP